MRPTAKRQSALQAPLSIALGTEARVRVLRVLAKSTEPIGVSKIAELAGLNERGVRTVLSRLEQVGAVMTIAGAGRQAMMREGWPLARRLRDLFMAEGYYAEALVASLRTAIESLKPPPLGAWIAGSYAAGVDKPGEPLIVVCYSDKADAMNHAEAGRALISRLAAEHDLVTPEWHVVTKRDVAVANAPESTLEADRRFRQPLLLISGVPPTTHSEPTSGRGVLDHRALDTQALRRAKAIGALILRDPSLIARTKAALEKRRETVGPRTRAVMDEWEMLLTQQPPRRIAQAITREDESMIRMRQSMPFFDALTHEERAFVESFVQHESEAREVAGDS